MREDVIRLRSKVNELQHEKSDLKKQHESYIADEEAEAAERVMVLADLRSLLECRNQQLNDMERSRDAIQLHSTKVQVTIVSLARELDEARATALTARATARLQITRMMDEQLIQSQTIEALRRQVHFGAASSGTTSC